MTDKVVKTGIEDVLSSIKRLVNEDDRKISSAFAPIGSRKPGRLVLTDALRVGETLTDQYPLPENQEPDYMAEDSVKPMLLRTCDIVRNTEPAGVQTPKAESLDGVTGSLSSKIEALEAAIARTEDQWEPDGDSDDAYSGTATQNIHWHAEDEFIVSESSSVTEAAPEQPKSDTKATFIRDPEAAAATRHTEYPEVGHAKPTISEDELRGIIAEVVREELQGLLGQRITRNVRKMVRREIYRAMAEQEVE